MCSSPSTLKGTVKEGLVDEGDRWILGLVELAVAGLGGWEG